MPEMPHMLRDVLSSVLGSSIARLILAAILGGLIGLEREIKHRPAGLRTNLFICFGAAMFTIMSDQLAVEHLGDHTRIAAQIIPGIGFIGAGSILHYRGDLVTGITSAATLFVVASVGMAVGGGQYLTGIFATGLILVCLFVLGRVEEWSNLKIELHTYEVTGPTAEAVTEEINRLLEPVHSMMQNVQVATTRQHARLQFEVEGKRRQHEQLLQALKQSPVFGKAVSLGRTQWE